MCITHIFTFLQTVLRRGHMKIGIKRMHKNSVVAFELKTYQLPIEHN